MRWPNVTRLFYRNVKVNTDPGSLTILIGLPAMYLVFFGYGFGAALAHGSYTTVYMTLLTPGLMAYQAVMAGVVGGGMLWADRRWGMLAQVLVGPFTRLQYLLGIMFTSIVFGLAGSLVILGIAYLLLGGLAVTGVGILEMLAIIVLGSIFFGALMLLIAAYIKSNNAYNSVQILVIFLASFSSTVFYQYSTSLPSALQVLFAINPLTYIADGVRGAFSGNYGSLVLGSIALELLILGIETVVVLILAVRAYMRSDVSME